MRSILSLTVLVLVASACDPWRDTAYYDRIVWSDDDEQLALVELRFEERDPLDPLQGTTDKRNFRHQLYVSDVDGANPTAIGSEREGQSAAEVFFMRSQGYVLLAAVREDGEADYARIDLDDGAETALSDPGFSARSWFAVPSPDGANIAQVGIEGTSAEVRFVDGATLDPVASVVTLTFQNTPDFTFRPDGALVVTDGVSAKGVHPGEEPFDTDVPACTLPKTTSSDVSSTGLFVFTDTDGRQISTRDEGEDAAFGCQ